MLKINQAFLADLAYILKHLQWIWAKILEKLKEGDLQKVRQSQEIEQIGLMPII